MTAAFKGNDFSGALVTDKKTIRHHYFEQLQRVIRKVTELSPKKEFQDINILLYACARFTRHSVTLYI